MEIMFKKVGSADLETVKKPIAGCWINVVSPDDAELQKLIEEYRIPSEFVRACLDDDEQPRFDDDEDTGAKLVILKVPDVGKEDIEPVTVGLIFVKRYFFTISNKHTELIRIFKNNPRRFYTTQQTRALLQILWSAVKFYISRLDEVDRKTETISDKIKGSISNKEIFQLLAIQKTLTHFKIATGSNLKLLKDIAAGKHFRLYDADKELLEDIVIENEQVLAMINTYLEISSNTMDAYASIVGNNMNHIMKTLTVWSIFLAVPVIVASFYGMNVALPMANHPYIFWITVGIGFLPAILLLAILRKLKWI